MRRPRRWADRGVRILSWREGGSRAGRRRVLELVIRGQCGRAGRLPGSLVRGKGCRRQSLSWSWQLNGQQGRACSTKEWNWWRVFVAKASRRGRGARKEGRGRGRGTRPGRQARKA